MLARLLPGCCALCGGIGPGPLCAGCSARLLDTAGMAAAVESAGSQPAQARYAADALALPTMLMPITPVMTLTPPMPQPMHGERCTCCAVRLPAAAAGLRCAACLRDPPSFDRTLALADYLPPLDRLLLDLKFHACLPLAAALGSLLARLAIAHGVCGWGQPQSAGAPPCLLIPVPLSAERLTERGFNQAQELARPLAKALQLPIAASACARIRHTQAQATLPVDERRVNMRSAFAVLQRQAIAGKAILVVDDVMTTGQTLEALAACLKRHGATHVTNLVIARTPAR